MNDIIIHYPNLVTLGERAKWARLHRHLTQQELAERIQRLISKSGAVVDDGKEIKQADISDIETGRNKNPAFIVEMASALQASPGWLRLGNAELDSLGIDAMQVAIAWQRLPEPQRSAIKTMIDSIATSNK